jgi:hypothetical protein
VVRAIPGIGGAAAVTTGAAAIAHAICHPLPALGVAAAVGGVFLLLLDAKL